MVRKILVAAILSGSLVAGYVLAADAGKNLKVLPKTLSKKELKDTMKGISKSLGVQCDYCHDMDDMAKDTEHKNEAREMMKMTAELNKKFFAGKPRVTCMTCHNGQKEPKK